jgi:hypothetical protein
VGNVSFEVGESGIVSGLSAISRPVESLIYPNPVTDQLSAYFFLEQASPALLTLSTADGKTALAQSIQLQGGGQVITVPVTGLSAGVYFLQVTAEGWSVRELIVKK